MSAPAFRAAARAAARSSTATRSRAAVPALRRGLASAAGEHAPKKASGDTVWMVASAAVFGSAFVYLVGPGAKKTGEHAHHRHGDGLDAKGEHAPQEHDEPENPDAEATGDGGDPKTGGMKDDEDTEQPPKDVAKQRDEKSDDSGKKASSGDKKEKKSGDAGDKNPSGLPTKDSEGNDVDPKEVTKSAQKGLNEDAPKDAKKAEESKSKK